MVLESVLVDPVNTGANIVGAGASLNSVDIARKQLEIATKAFNLSLENNKDQVEVKSLLVDILNEIKKLNNNISKLK